MITPQSFRGYLDFARHINAYGDPLPDCISMRVTERLNGEYELELTYPIDGINAERLTKTTLTPIIAVEPWAGSGREPFRVYEWTDGLDGIRTVKARHHVYDSALFVHGLSPTTINATGITAIVARLNALVHGYNSLGLNFVNNGITDETPTLYVAEPCDIWTLVGKVVELFGAEMSYTYDPNTGKVDVTFNKHRGTVNDATIRYGINLTDYRKTTDLTTRFNVVRAICKVDNDDGTTTFVTATASTGVQVGNPTRELVLDWSSEYDGLPTSAQLQNDLTAFVAAGTWEGTESVSSSFIPLGNTTEYDLPESIQCGDTLTIDGGKYGTITARVIETVYNPLTQKYESVTIGQAEKTIADTIAGLSDSQVVESRLMATGSEAMRSVASGSTDTIAVSFGKTFGTPPTVVACIYSNQTIGLGQCTASVYNITTTGFSLRLTNGYSSARNLGATWIAM